MTEAASEVIEKPERYWEIDAIRGLAILGMLVFHTFAGLAFFHIVPDNASFHRFYDAYVFGTALFILIAGTSMVLRHERMRGHTDKEYYKALIYRSLILFGIAICITIVSWIGSTVVTGTNRFLIIFGFLHMLSISMLIGIPLLKFKRLNVIFGLIVMIIGIFIIPEISGPSWLMPIGIYEPGFATGVDYFPLLPWTGVLLLGIGLGNIFYPKGIRSYSIPDPKKLGTFFSKIGNGMITLTIYLVHAPLIFVILSIFSALTGIGYL